MKRFLISFAKRFRRATANSSDDNSESGPSPQPSALFGKEDALEPRSKIPPASNTAISLSASKQQGDLRIQQAVLKSNETGDTSSFNPDFITREELKRELDLVRRLIESRK